MCKGLRGAVGPEVGGARTCRPRASGRAVDAGWIDDAVFALVRFDCVAVGQMGDSVALLEEAVWVVAGELAGCCAKVVGVEQAGDGVAYGAEPDKAGVFHALAEAVVVAAGVAGQGRGADADQGRGGAVGISHAAFRRTRLPVWQSKPDFAQVHGGEVLVGDAEQQVAAVAIEDLAAWGCGRPSLRRRRRS